MNSNDIATNERGVSPVVGVALLIGITVILAAVIGTVVLGVGVGPIEEPQATLSFEVIDGEVVLKHEGGEPLDAEEIVVLDQNGDELAGLDDELSTGEREVIVEDIAGVERVSVVWQNPGGDSEAILATFRP